MLRQRRALAGPVRVRDFAADADTSSTRSLPKPAAQPLSLTPKRSGLLNLTRSGYDEEKCRNVLVRYCAHIPRNYQYKDGIQQIFLILRDHVGDENLDLAGGVLYELIEIDCGHTDDPGAAFQRWRHDHMRRYSDFELPHVPHMTTITSSIIPTERLARWRLEHRDRYTFVLSDSSPTSQRFSFDPSCIRTRKAWLIDHTFYVSSRIDEFHEMQWNSNYGSGGKFVQEREVPLDSRGRPSATTAVPAAGTTQPRVTRFKPLRRSLSKTGVVDHVTSKLDKSKIESETKQRRRSWMPSAFGFDSGSMFRDKRSATETTSVPLPDGCQIPHGIFARKFALVADGDTLPPFLPLRQMPTAEKKAVDTFVDAAATGCLSRSSAWSFQGPFTPQLWFDGGLDYQWGYRDPSITVRRFDLEAPLPANPEPVFPSPFRESRFRRSETHTAKTQSRSRRRAQVFDLEEFRGRKTHGLDRLPTLHRSRNIWSAQAPAILALSTPYTNTFNPNHNIRAHRF
ncbi:hypothetical protein F4780DRAFT_773790 [Xylariomycetidae sp. FL0641]|nr:hypothetical protein F4780DRAFT_773790 [Xylariomycetidae sp. FL0641]